MLEDFIRWYSPAEWQVADGAGAATPDGSNGRLSERFNEPSDLWVVLWRETLPMAAAAQRPLFDIDRESQQALDRLDALAPSMLLPQLVYAAIEGALAALATSPMAALSPRAGPMLNDLGRSLCSLYERRARAAEWRQTLHAPLAELELELSRAHSLDAKLPNQADLVREMLAHPSLDHEVAVSRAARLGLQQHLQAASTPPSARSRSSAKMAPVPHLSETRGEYILRACVCRPEGEPDCVPTSQRMYVAHVSNGQFRLAVALSADNGV